MHVACSKEMFLLWHTHTHTHTFSDTFRQTDRRTHTHIHTHTCTHAQCRERSGGGWGGGLGRLPAGLVWGFQNHGQLTWSSSSEVSSLSALAAASLFDNGSSLKSPQNSVSSLWHQPHLTVTGLNRDFVSPFFFLSSLLFRGSFFCRPAPLALCVGDSVSSPLQLGERCIWCKMWWWCCFCKKK